MMTEEAVRARLAELKAQAQQLRDNLLAVDGAIQDCEFWLAKFKPPESENGSNLPETS